MEFLEDISALSVIAITVVLIARWRGQGVLVAIPFGWVAIHLINISFPHNQWSEIEFAEDWPFMGWFVMLIWSALVYMIVRSLRALTKWWWKLNEKCA